MNTILKNINQTSNTSSTMQKHTEFQSMNLCPDMSSPNGILSRNEDVYYNTTDTVMNKLRNVMTLSPDEELDWEEAAKVWNSLHVLSTSKQFLTDLIEQIDTIMKYVTAIVQECLKYESQLAEKASTFGKVITQVAAVVRNCSDNEGGRAKLQLFPSQLMYLVGIVTRVEHFNKKSRPNILSCFDDDFKFNWSFPETDDTHMLTSIACCINNLWLSTDKSQLTLSESYYCIMADALLHLFCMTQDRQSLELLHQVYSVLYNTINNETNVTLSKETRDAFSKFLSNNSMVLTEHFCMFNKRKSAVISETN
ncbi:hypothetical protein C9374_010577 [Naegleria lovaniensis]|uniref:Uncharacterized protein n=1 Tax=Naegleria lovaniensis TaxID=51637 RepID=A0AA88GG47_NAELO|nr:uncharacterized protein C9374_010577 [Naegleria lovaniensis]KAG2374558.1 hypothetical protein C9374_010577 [Naegleria lovaniensis]